MDWGVAITTQTELKTVRLSVSNPAHSLSVLVAHEEGLFREEGLDVELIKTAGSALYMTEEIGGRLEPHELQTWRLLYAPPAPYTRERFQRTSQWMISYPDLVATGATYESVVDNRAWE